MRINELTVLSDEFDISDAVVFHDELNPKLWTSQGELDPEIRRGLLTIAKDFIEFLGVSLKVVDVTISGSNAAYSYTKHSDIDLHVVAKIDPSDKKLAELFDAKKNVYNTEHDIKIKGIDVELYVQPAHEVHHSLGIYSVLKNIWLSTPKREHVKVNSDDVKKKYRNYRDEIRTVLKSEDKAVVKAVWDNIKRMRKAGLAKSGEFGVENIAFKILRNQGWLGKLRDHIQSLKDKELSIEQRRTL